MALVTRKFSSLRALNTYVLGKIRGGVDLFRTGNALFLHGKTLDFTTPAGTVTFAATPAGAQVPLPLAQVKIQIEAQVATVKAEIVDGNLVLSAVTPGVITLAITGTANAQLGFDTAVATTAAPVNPSSGAVPKFVALAPGGSDSSLYLMTDE